MDLETIARRQAGVLSRDQARRFLTEEAIRHRLTSRRWRRIHPGVYLTSSGQADWRARAHAALLHCGPGAALSLGSAAYLLGLSEKAPAVLNVVIPNGRKVAAVPGVRIRRSRADETVIRRGLRVTAPARTVLDLADQRGLGAEAAIALAADAVRSRRLSGQELTDALGRRARHRHRQALRLALGEIDQGTQSLLEVRTLRRVIRAHALPPFALQVLDRDCGVRRDFECQEYGVILEVDGRLGHLGAGRLADYRRDREAARTGRITLRAGWHDVSESPCELAADLLGALRARGYPGRLRACGPTCTAGSPAGLARGLR